MIARFPAAKASGYNGVVFSWSVAREKATELKEAAKASGYNGVVFSWNIAREKATELKEATKANGLDLVAMVMGGSHDRN